jgi:hypothetical protein
MDLRRSENNQAILFYLVFQDMVVEDSEDIAFDQKPKNDSNFSFSASCINEIKFSFVEFIPD